ncbi:MAG: diguanylate cyclase [Rhodoferax sp.]|uniref:GGDEF domain-containing protein n=1 Tax=Rhodoferax sp. TaxID=50421 RepID=UPI002607F1DF|nr:diguanylate cyclase [Rhodoferax sp.]MDD2881365.1 diguanylate cyclase [Rhodoferax sp.]
MCAQSAGQTQAFWLQAQQIQGDESELRALKVFCLSDITHLILREHRLRWLADTDALTGLANRNLLLARMDEVTALEGQGSITLPSILFIDLDGCKQVNDQLGHGTGDRILQESILLCLKNSTNQSPGMTHHGHPRL